MEKRFVYVDNAATTPVSDSVYQAMQPYLKEKFGNPSSIYSIAHEAKFAVEHARKKIAQSLGALEEEIYFTSCGTEADNWAIKSMAYAMAKKGKKHLITTNIEHHAVLHTCQSLEKDGFSVTYLPVNAEGFVTPEQVEKAILDDTGLVSVMYANNEVGSIQPIAEIAAVCKKAGVYFHTDAVQAVGNIKINVKEQNIDLLSLSGHKIHAPKGVGALYVRKGVPIVPYLDGGAQERGRRGGTENVAFIVALGKAVADAVTSIEERVSKLTPLRDELIDGILKTIPKCRLNGARHHRLCNNVNISFEGIEGESILLMLDAEGICASSGSACTSGSLNPSHVLLAMGIPAEVAHGSLRMTLGDHTSKEDIAYILEVLPKAIHRLREISPVWKNE